MYDLFNKSMLKFLYSVGTGNAMFGVYVSSAPIKAEDVEALQLICTLQYLSQVVIADFFKEVLALVTCHN